MEKVIIKFGDIEIKKKKKNHQYKRPISIKNVDINKIVVCNKVCLGKMGFKYFTAYKYAKKNKTLCICLLKTSAYTIWCLIEGGELEYLGSLEKSPKPH